MKERKSENINFQDINHRFVEEMWQLSADDINALTSIVYWVFGSTSDSDEKFYFIKNRLFSSNYREKIGGKLSYGGLFQFLEEVDTGNPIQYEQDGQLTSESWNKISEFKKELKSIYTKEFI